MKRRYLFLLLLCLCFSLFAAKPTNTFQGMATVDQYGEKVDGSIFGDYDITMVNIFTTWCRYCIQEMPEIIRLKNNLPEGMNIIGICCDAKTSPEAFRKLLSQFDFNFQVLTLTDAEILGILSLTGYPTTVFVDRNGKIVNTKVGAPKSPYADYLRLLTTSRAMAL